MNKGVSLLILILATAFSYGQEINFQKNEGYTARKLKLIQKLSKDGDSLILESDKKKIRQVDILNEDYLESIVIDSTKGKIDLTKLSIGNYVVQARIGRHWIVMYLEKTADIKETSKELLISKKTSKKKLFDEGKMYWVVYESNSQFSSQKTMSLKCVDEIKDLIYKIELELKTELSKNNRLFVYEIYNKTIFIRKQLRNNKYYKSKKSKFFNTEPVYKAENKEVAILQI